MASCAARLLFQPARVNSHVPLSPLTVSSRSPLLITWDKDKDNNINNRFLFKLSQRNLTSVAKSSPESDGIVPADEDGVSLGTLKLPSNTNLQRFESLLFQVHNITHTHTHTYKSLFILILIIFITLNSGATVFAKELICHYLYLWRWVAYLLYYYITIFFHFISFII